MRERLWRGVARIASRPRVAHWLIERAMKTPYFHLERTDGEVYMCRWWLFNPYDFTSRRTRLRWFPWSVRVHWIRLPDEDTHLHDHPWDARTIILRGWYTEERPYGSKLSRKSLYFRDSVIRNEGDTVRLKHGQYHRISRVAPDGAFTLFITGPYVGTWGFLVDGVKVPWRKHLGQA